jgi:hypothetical protein
METPGSLIESIIESGEAYTKTSIELAKLKGLETTTNVVTTLIWRISIALIFTLSVLVLNIGIALYLGELLGKNYYGFLIVSAFYLVAGLVLHFVLHGWIKKPIGKLIITQVLQ